MAGKIGLVLGAGGVVGLAYHAGVLRALEVEGGVAAGDADLIVGTSAGSVIGAYLRSGWTTEDCYQLALGTHPSWQPFVTDGGGEIISPSFRTPVELLRRGLGSAYVLGRSVMPFAPVRVPAVLRAAFPGGLFTMNAGRRRLIDELPDAWPERPLWLCAFDIGRGRRVVLGRDRLPQTTLATAVLASCAIPGMYVPVRVGRATLVDGGVHSTTNLDLAVQHGCDVVIAVAPMAYDTLSPPPPFAQLARRVPARMLSAEVAAARRSGASVLLLRPSASEVRGHGFNLMRPTGLERIARAAYESTARALTTDRFQAVLGDLAA